MKHATVFDSSAFKNDSMTCSIVLVECRQVAFDAHSLACNLILNCENVLNFSNRHSHQLMKGKNDQSDVAEPSIQCKMCFREKFCQLKNECNINTNLLLLSCENVSFYLIRLNFSMTILQKRMLHKVK